MKNIIFIAPPAAGKGTHSKKLVDKFNYVHISTGDMLREVIQTGSELGLEVKSIIDQGKLVSDELIIKLINNKLADIKGKPFILDGFPRTLSQAKALDSIVNDDYVVIYLDIDKETAIKRIEGRLTCSCGASYNINEEAFRPQVEGICDKCGSKLVKRDDDNALAFAVRYDTFLENTKPLYEYYEKKNKLHVIDVNKDASEIFDEISRIVAND